MIDSLGQPQSVLLIGGTSEIGLAVVRRLAVGGRLQTAVLAGRDLSRLACAAADLSVVVTDVRCLRLELTDASSVAPAIDAVFGGDGLDVAVLAAGVLPAADADPVDPAMVNFVGQIAAGTRIVQRFQQQGRGVLVVLSSVAAERPRADNYLYGATKAGLDAWANGLADNLHGSPVRILVVRPGMVRTRMSAGLPEAPMTVDPDDVAEAVAQHLVRGPTTIWVPAALQPLMSGIRHLPRPLFRRLAAQARGGTTEP